MLFRLWRAGEPAIFTVLTHTVKVSWVRVKPSVGSAIDGAMAWEDEHLENSPLAKGDQREKIHKGLDVSHLQTRTFPGKTFAILLEVIQSQAMTQPLALVVYEKLLPGSQLVNRLQDLKYRVQSIADPERLPECAEQVKPMLVMADLDTKREAVFAAVTRLRENATTRHLPVIGFCAETATDLHEAAQKAGVTLIASEVAILNHLPQFLDQALQVE
jgi:PleD family two-component response regulator